jgi:hypothetical protein
MKGKPLPKPEIKSEVKSPSQIKSKPKFLPGFAIVALEPDKSDARPFGIGNLTQAYTSNDAMMEIELYMPDTLSDIVILRYTAVKERRGMKKRQSSNIIPQFRPERRNTPTGSRRTSPKILGSN